MTWRRLGDCQSLSGHSLPPSSIKDEKSEFLLFPGARPGWLGWRQLGFGADPAGERAAGRLRRQAVALPGGEFWTGSEEPDISASYRVGRPKHPVARGSLRDAR